MIYHNSLEIVLLDKDSRAREGGDGRGREMEQVKEELAVHTNLDRPN